MELTDFPSPSLPEEAPWLSPEETPWSSPDIEFPTVSPIETNAPFNSPAPSQQSVPTFPCDHYDLIHDLQELNHTNNYQRVSMQIQIAGPNLTNTCGLSPDIVQKFINFSALNTQSDPNMWYVTRIEDGPPIYSVQAPLVTIDEPDEFFEVNNTSSPSPSPISENEQLYPGSVIFAVMVYFPPLSVDLAEGSYIDYVMSQRMVDALQDEGYKYIEWTGMLSSPHVIDIRSEATSPTASGSSIAGVSAAVCALIATIAVVAVLVSQDGVASAVFGLGRTPPSPILPVTI